MPKPATVIVLSPDEREQLAAMLRKPKAQARYVQRAWIILRASEGTATREIARQLPGHTGDGWQVAHTF